MSAGVKIGAVLLVALGLALSSSPAFAGSAGAGSSGTGSAGAGAGGGTVSVGVSTSSGSPGSGTSGSGGNADDGGGGSGSQCTYTPITLAAAGGFALPPGGAGPGYWYLVQCPGTQADEDGYPLWIPTGPGASPPPVVAGPGVSARALALQAASSIVLPSPSIEVNPAPFSVVNLPTWLAIDPVLWHPYQATASVGGVSATATATPETVAWTMGDGTVVDCTGPGAQYNVELAPNAQSTSCFHTYTRSSDGEPSSDGNADDGAFAVTATVTWDVTWIAVGAPGGGLLPSLRTQSTQAVRVEQIESIGVVQ